MKKFFGKCKKRDRKEVKRVEKGIRREKKYKILLIIDKQHIKHRLWRHYQNIKIPFETKKCHI